MKDFALNAYWPSQFKKNLDLNQNEGEGGAEKVIRKNSKLHNRKKVVKM